MDDLISRQAALDSIWDGTNYDIYTKEVKEHLEELQAADVVEVVRCKDCKFYEIYPNGANGDCINQIDAFNTFYPDDYCSYGERAET